MYSIMDNSNISWNCLKCGLPNFSSTFFNQSIPSSLSTHFFSVLSCNIPGEPIATSSPKSIHSHSSLYHHTSTTYHGYHTNRKCKTVNRPLRIISLNFQSITNKKPELDLLLNTTKPDVIIGIETWLTLLYHLPNTSLPSDILCTEGTDPHTKSINHRTHKILTVCGIYSKIVYRCQFQKNIPTKTIKYDNKLPWISEELRKKMNKYRRKLRKRQSKNPEK